LIEGYSNQLYRARLYTIEERKFPMHSVQEHRAIIAAMRIKDGAAARQLMEFHRERGGKEIIRIIRQKAAEGKTKPDDV
jgi:FCD domain.